MSDQDHLKLDSHIYLEGSSFNKVKTGFVNDDIGGSDDEVKIRKDHYQILADGSRVKLTAVNTNIAVYSHGTGRMRPIDSTKPTKSSTEIDNILNRQGKDHPLQMRWLFSGESKLGSISLTIKDQAWHEYFSRMRLPVKMSFMLKRKLALQSQQVIYAKMQAILKKVDKNQKSQVVALCGPPGMGKSFCAQYYLYHEAPKQYQMVAWISGESKTIFKREWTLLAAQIRVYDSQLHGKNDNTVIQQWFEEKLSHWLFIIDNVNIDREWLAQYLPKTGGNILITTRHTSYWAQQTSILTIPLFALSGEDSNALLHSYFGSSWSVTGRADEQRAINYLIAAVGRSPLALSQLALFSKRKRVNFSRLMQQFNSATTQAYILNDTVLGCFNKEATFGKIWFLSMQQLLVQLKKMGGGESGENKSQESGKKKQQSWLATFFNNIIAYISQLDNRQPVYSVPVNEMLAWTDLKSNEERLFYQQCLTNYLPLTYDKKSHSWQISQAATGVIRQLLAACGEVQVAKKSNEEKSTLKNKSTVKMPSVKVPISHTMTLKDSGISHATLNFLTNKDPDSLLHWQLPVSSAKFIPREKLINQLKEKLQSDKKVDSSNNKARIFVIAAVNGMGGVGKTVLAQHMITQHTIAKSFKKRFWMDASSSAQMRVEFLRLAEYIGLLHSGKDIDDRELIRLVHTWLLTVSDWLIVFDNADDFDDIAVWIPKFGGTVLITTRDPAPGNLTKANVLTVPVLEKEEAVSWLCILAERNLTDEELKHASCLVKALGFLPLAIVQVAAYLSAHPDVTVEHYATNFSTLILEHQKTSEIDDAKNEKKNSDSACSRLVIAKTWTISLNAIRNQDKLLKRPSIAEKLIKTCAYWASNNIPIALLETGLKQWINKSDQEEASYWLDDYLSQLLKYSLIKREFYKNNLSIHPLVQLTLRKGELAECNKNHLRMAHHSLYLKIDKTEYRGVRKMNTYLMLLPHFRSLIDVIVENSDFYIWKDKENIHKSIFFLMYYTATSGDINKSRYYLDIVKSLFKKFGKEYNSALNRLVSTFFDESARFEVKDGNLESALSLHNFAAKMRRDVSLHSKYYHNGYADFYYGLLYHEMGDLEKAIEWMGYAEKRVVSTLGSFTSNIDLLCVYYNSIIINIRFANKNNGDSKESKRYVSLALELEKIISKDNKSAFGLAISRFYFYIGSYYSYYCKKKSLHYLESSLSMRSKLGGAHLPFRVSAMLAIAQITTDVAIKHTYVSESVKLVRKYKHDSHAIMMLLQTLRFSGGSFGYRIREIIPLIERYDFIAFLRASLLEEKEQKNSDLLAEIEKFYLSLKEQLTLQSKPVEKSEEKNKDKNNNLDIGSGLFSSGSITANKEATNLDGNKSSELNLFKE